MKEFDLRRNNGGRRKGAGRKSKFANPAKLRLTLEKELLISLRSRFGVKLNDMFCDFFKNLEKNDDFLKKKS